MAVQDFSGDNAEGSALFVLEEELEGVDLASDREQKIIADLNLERGLISNIDNIFT